MRRRNVSFCIWTDFGFNCVNSDRSPETPETSACHFLHPFAFALLLASTAVACSGKQPAPARTSTPPVSGQALPAMTVPRQRSEGFEYLTRQTPSAPATRTRAATGRCLQYLQSTLQQSADEDAAPAVHHTQGTMAQTLSSPTVIASFKPHVKGTRAPLCPLDTAPQGRSDGNPAEGTSLFWVANDGASGVAVLLEIAALLSRPHLRSALICPLRR